MTDKTKIEPTTPIIVNRWLTIVLYLSAVFLFWMAQYIYLPTLPTYIQSKTSNLALVGMVLSMYGLWQAIIRLPLGIVTDWVGWRKPFVLVGLALAGLGAWIMGTADNVNGLAIGRAITGLAAGTWVPLVVGFSGLFPPQEAVKASALLTLCNSIGRMLATSITGSLNEWGGYTLAFYAAMALATLSVLVMLIVHEPRRQPLRPSASSLVNLTMRRDVLVPALINAVGQYASWGISFGFMPVLVKQLGGTGVTQSLFMTLNIATLALGNLGTTWMANRIGARQLVRLGFGLLFIGIGMAALAPKISMLLAAQICMGLALGVIYPTLMGMSIRYVANIERTTAMGLHQAVYAIGMFAGPALSGKLADAIGLQPMMGLTAFGCLAFGLLGTLWISH